jgi:hypothetical protein
MFGPDELKKSIEDTLNSTITIPDGHKGAFVTIADLSGVHVAVAAKVGKGWIVEGEVAYLPHAGGLETGVKIQKTW